MIVNGFKKCCIPNAKDGTEGGMLWNCSEDYGKVRSRCEEDDDTDCEDGDSDTNC